MAPTEVLARQHYENALNELEPRGIHCALLTGSVTGARRREVLAGLADGSIQLAIGTHALISDGVEYAKLGLVVTDEQHRFGVRQRTKLSEKGQNPNTLVMSATPIPRTLALVIYGDLDVSVIDELPPGRTPVRTHIVPEHKLDGLYGFVRARVAEGRQAYFVCPLVEDSEETDATSAEQLYEELNTRRLRGLKIELVHGRMRPAEKDAVLERFRSGETQCRLHDRNRGGRERAQRQRDGHSERGEVRFKPIAPAPRARGARSVRKLLLPAGRKVRTAGRLLPHQRRVRDRTAGLGPARRGRIDGRKAVGHGRADERIDERRAGADRGDA